MAPLLVLPFGSVPSPAMAPPRDILLKIIVLGDRGQGWSLELTIRFALKKFTEQYKATSSADFFTKEIQIGDNHVTFQIWDTAGLEMFQSLGHAFCSGADCFILVYDVNVHRSFNTHDTWYEEILKQILQASPSDPIKFPLILLGDKVDVDGGKSRVVSVKRAEEWCASRDNIPYLETSAKKDYHVVDAFLRAAQLSTRQVP